MGRGMGRFWSSFAFFFMCIFLLTWNATSQPYPEYYQPNEAPAIYGMLKSWNDSGTNVSALWPDWALNRSAPCSVSHDLPWLRCLGSFIHIDNLTGYVFTLVGMFIGEPGEWYPPSDPYPAIVGELPKAIENLTDFQYLSITGQRGLSGPLPNGIFTYALRNLQRLQLVGCSLSGSLPIQGFWNNTLEVLDLSDNLFNGSTPFCRYYDFNSLQKLNLSNNQFSGAFCSNITSSIESIDISNNGFNDIIIPGSSIHFPLKFIFARHNLLQSFPSQLLQLPELQEIYLDSNNISGLLVLPYVSTVTSSLRLISLINNKITNLQPSEEIDSLLNHNSLQISQLLFLGGNPICNDSRTSELLRMVCRFNRSSPIEDLYHESRRESNKITIIISACISAIVLILLMITFIVIKKLLKEISTMREIQNEFNKKDVKPNLYSYTELKVATQDFHSNNELGRGGFGIVYKGVLIDGSRVAVKKLSKAKKDQDIQDFLNEIIVISNIKHRNLVQLKGCCIKGDQRILVYELVDNKNLAESLWGDSNDLVHFDWATRFSIILGIARGLAYLHEEVEPSIIHRDIKGPNILLDKDLSPKIADFGLALFYPSLDDGETHMSVSKVAGTMGYLSPEYALYGQVSTKLDVFSFGVLVLEIVSGRKNISHSLPSSQQYLAQWAQSLHANKKLLELVDNSLQEVTTTEHATIQRVVEVGLLCLHHLPARRPTMSDIIAMILGNKEIQHLSFNEYHGANSQGDGFASSSLPSNDLWFLSSVQEEVAREGDVEMHGITPLLTKSKSIIQ